jgi:riboflavin kinase / FMN adenylyltransferase
MSLRVLRGLDGWRGDAAVSARRTALAIGNFDGVHLGHQAILRRVVAHARRAGSLSTAITFDPHPLKFLRPEHAPQLASKLEQRIAWMEALGLEAVLVLPFNRELSLVSPEDFVSQVLAGALHAERIFVGEGFCFGHRHAGNVALLGKLSGRFDYHVEIMPPVKSRGATVSSTGLRSAIAEGRMDIAARLMGRPFTLTGKIVTGTGTGRREVVPTLNLQCDQELLPAQGVYVTEARLAGPVHDGTDGWNPAATNIGTRPTFDGQGLSVETHLLDLDLRVSGSSMELRFWKRLRSEKKFSGPAALKKQIESDLRSARAYFSHRSRVRRKTQTA